MGFFNQCRESDSFIKAECKFICYPSGIRDQCWCKYNDERIPMKRKIALNKNKNEIIENFKPLTKNEKNPFRMCMRKQMTNKSIIKCNILPHMVDGSRKAISDCKLISITSEKEPLRVDITADESLNRYFSQEDAYVSLPEKSLFDEEDQSMTFPEPSDPLQVEAVVHRIDDENKPHHHTDFEDFLANKNINNNIKQLTSGNSQPLVSENTIGTTDPLLYGLFMLSIIVLLVFIYYWGWKKMKALRRRYMYKPFSSLLSSKTN